MKLFITPASPYARIAVAAAVVLEVKVEVVVVPVRTEADELLRYNPAAKVPSLELDNGVVLSETRLICDYLESRSRTSILALVANHTERQWEGMLTGFLDGVAVWIRELRRPANEQSPSIIELEAQRCARCLAYLEQYWHFRHELNYASILLVSTLNVIDIALPVAWRQEQPQLSTWYQALSATAAMQLSAPPA